MSSRKTPDSTGARYHQPRNVEEMTEQNVQTIVQLEETAKANRDKTDQMADVIAQFCGSFTFVWVHLIWFAAWIVINIIPGLPHFDAYPFTFLTLVVSLEAIFLSTFILISQNHETRVSERRNQLDLQINLLTEQENTKMIRILLQIAQKLDIDVDEDPTVRILEQPTQPEKLVEQIKRETNEKESVKFKIK